MELIKASVEFIKIAIVGFGGGMIEMFISESFLPFLKAIAFIFILVLAFGFINKFK